MSIHNLYVCHWIFQSCAWCSHKIWLDRPFLLSNQQQYSQSFQHKQHLHETNNNDNFVEVITGKKKQCMCGNMARSLKVLPVCLHVCVAHFCAKTGLAERRLRFAPPTFHALRHCRELHWFQLRHVRLPEIQAICNQLGWKMTELIGHSAQLARQRSKGQGSPFSCQHECCIRVH